MISLSFDTPPLGAVSTSAKLAALKLHKLFQLLPYADFHLLCAVRLVLHTCGIFTRKSLGLSGPENVMAKVSSLIVILSSLEMLS
jgi:hypothetical protein